MNARFGKLLAALRHAFAVETRYVLAPEDVELLDRAATAVVQRRMSGPALVVLESLRPLNYVSSQCMVFLEPLVGSFVSTCDYDRMAHMLEHRETLQVLIDTIATREAARERVGHGKGG